MGNALVQHAITVQIDTDPGGTETLTEIKGLLDFDESLNDVVNDYQYLDNNGFGESEHTGMHPMYTFTGKRILDDAGQNWVFGKKFTVGDRKTTLVFTHPKGAQTVTTRVAVTLGAIQEFAGAATDNTDISIEFRANAAPAVTTA